MVRSITYDMIGNYRANEWAAQFDGAPFDLSLIGTATTYREISEILDEYNGRPTQRSWAKSVWCTLKYRPFMSCLAWAREFDYDVKLIDKTSPIVLQFVPHNLLSN